METKVQESPWLFIDSLTYGPNSTNQNHHAVLARTGRMAPVQWEMAPGWGYATSKNPIADNRSIEIAMLGHIQFGVYTFFGHQRESLRSYLP